jgi:hypothetical protein
MIRSHLALVAAEVPIAENVAVVPADAVQVSNAGTESGTRVRTF